MKILNNLDLVKNELQNARIQHLAAAPLQVNSVSGQIYYNSVQNILYYNDGTQWLPIIPGIPYSYLETTLTDDSDLKVATSKAVADYVKAKMQGLNWKPAVRVATTENITLTSSPTLTIDGKTVVDGDRVLVKDQTTGSQNGIYVYNSGTLSYIRASDADSSDELKGATVQVLEGTVNESKIYHLVTDNITLNTTALVFEKVFNDTLYIEGDGIIISGNIISADIIGTEGITVTTVAGQTVVKLDSTRQTAKVISSLIGNGSDKSYTITHNLGHTNYSVSIHKVSTGEAVLANILHELNTATITFEPTAPTTSEYKVVIIGY